jgi:hypothetical protein
MHLSLARTALSLSLLALVTACAASNKTISETSTNQAIDGVPDACLVRKTASSASAPAPSDPVTAIPGANQGYGTLTPPPIPAAPAAPLRCANDAECGAGARCDTALSPPTCVILYCVPEKGACSAAEQCADGMKCHKEACNPCNQCGDLCEVDFATDPLHCGGCNKKISSAQTCVAGEAACPANRPSLCGDECVDTTTDPRHCGACNVATPAGGTCKKGKRTCDTDQETCSGACVDTSKDHANCGACGHVCATDLECGGGYCYKTLSTTTAQNCFNVCQAANLRCAGAASIYTSSTQPTKVVEIGCGVLPGPAPAGFTFSAVSCACVER